MRAEARLQPAFFGRVDLAAALQKLVQSDAGSGASESLNRQATARVSYSPICTARVVFCQDSQVSWRGIFRTRPLPLLSSPPLCRARPGGGGPRLSRPD